MFSQQNLEKTQLNGAKIECFLFKKMAFVPGFFFWIKPTRVQKMGFVLDFFHCIKTIRVQKMAFSC